MYFNGKLSVVVISRNEEQNISRCIESVLSAVEGIDHEILLVDSASTDNTIEVAKKYPITILQLKPEWPLSAAAGRYIGSLLAKGKYIQFQDGDTTLDKEWFKHSIPYLEEHANVAGVVGIITQEEYDNMVAKRWIEASKNQKIGEIDYYEEDILLRKDVLEEVGAFNPYLKALEEGELSYRILAKGYKLVRLPRRMSHHLGGFEDNIFKMIKRKQIFAMACGQILRYSKGNKNILGMYWNDYKYIILFFGLMFYGIPSFLLILVDIDIFVYIWLAGMVFLFTYMAYEKKSIAYAVNHTISMFIRLPYFVKGIFIKPKSVGNYPINVEIIKKDKKHDEV